MSGVPTRERGNEEIEPSTTFWLGVPTQERGNEIFEIKMDSGIAGMKI